MQPFDSVNIINIGLVKETTWTKGEQAISDYADVA